MWGPTMNTAYFWNGGLGQALFREALSNRTHSRGSVQLSNKNCFK